MKGKDVQSKKQLKKHPLKRNYRNYTPALLNEVIRSIKRKQISINAAAVKYGIPKGTIVNKVKGSHEGKPGRPDELSAHEVRIILDHVTIVSDWGFPFDMNDLLYHLFFVLFFAVLSVQ